MTSGFELADRLNNTNAASADGTFGGTNVPTIETTIVRSGVNSAKCSSGAGAGNSWVQCSPYVSNLTTTVYLRMYFRFQTLPTGNTIICYGDPNNSVVFDVRYLSATKNLQLTDRTTGGAAGGTSTQISTGEWNMLQVAIVLNGSGNATTATAVLNGVQFATSTLNTPAAFRNFFCGLPDATVLAANTDIYLDDMAINDGTGASQTSYPPEGKVVGLFPLSDSAVGAGWTLGTGTAISSNGFGSVDNKPPVGVADLAAGSDPKQIRNASANANTNYDANMTSYTAAGIGVSDTVTVVTPMVATAAPASTSAKQGTVGLVSNPAITNVALSAQGTSGAFWNGTIAGTYATGWKWSQGTPTINPTVTKGTQPVMRITQVTSSTRIAMVCAMMVTVEYTLGPQISQPCNFASGAMLMQTLRELWRRRRRRILIPDLRPRRQPRLVRP